MKYKARTGFSKQKAEGGKWSSYFKVGSKKEIMSH
jgi:hypothetical protein